MMTPTSLDWANVKTEEAFHEFPIPIPHHCFRGDTTLFKLQFGTVYRYPKSLLHIGLNIS